MTTTLKLPANDAHFDVAFSFVSATDLSTANELGALLEPELSTFVYTERQDVVGGGEGMSAYSTIFKKQSSLTVILLRAEWGRTQWTAVEAAAIRDRALETGFRSFMVVAMEPETELPVWIPSTTIYQHGWRESRVETAAVIRARARDVGAILKTESPADRARRRAQVKQTARDRQEFLTSNRGAAAAREEFICLAASSAPPLGCLGSA